jgi:hypothetical protein
MIQLFRLIAAVGALLVIAASCLYYHKSTPKMELIELLASAGNTYFGPKSPPAGNPQLIYVQIYLKDSPDSAGPELVQVQFDHTNIPLKPRDLRGDRGSASFQLKPGKYKLRWKVNLHRYEWPRTSDHEIEVTLDPRDLWIQLEIEGETATIS